MIRFLLKIGKHYHCGLKKAVTDGARNKLLWEQLIETRNVSQVHFMFSFTNCNLKLENKHCYMFYCCRDNDASYLALIEASSLALKSQQGLLESLVGQ